MNIADLRAPDWRWQQAQAFVLAALHGTYVTLPLDPIVVYVARMFRADRDPNTRAFMQLKLPLLYTMFKLGGPNGDTAMRATLLAHILTCKKLSLVLLKLSWINPIQLHFYKDTFFDIDAARGIEAWVLDKLLNPVRNRANARLHRTRQLALTAGLDAALGAIDWGKMTPASRLALTKIFKNEQLKQLIDNCMLRLSVDPTTMATIMHNTFNKILDRLLQKLLHYLSGALDKSIALLAHSILKAVRTYTAVLKLDAANDASDDSQGVIDNLKHKK